MNFILYFIYWALTEVYERKNCWIGEPVNYPLSWNLMASFHPRNIGRFLRPAVAFLPLRVINEIWGRQARQYHEGFVPDCECWTNWKNEGHIKSMKMKRVSWIIERQHVVVIIQEHTQALQLWGHIHQHFLVVMSHHEVTITTREDPRGGILANPFILWSWFVGNTNCIPCWGTHDNFPVVAATVNEYISCCPIAPCATKPLWGMAFLQRALILLHLQAIIGDLQLLVSHFGI